MAPNTSIVWRCDLRDSELFVMIVVSSANCEILASLSFGKRILIINIPIIIIIIIIN